MLLVKPEKLLVKDPVVALSVVFELAVVGFCEVLQQTPLAVIVVPKSFVIFPPLVADVEVMFEAAVVEATVGGWVVAVPPIILVYAVPLYTCASPGPQSVQ